MFLVEISIGSARTRGRAENPPARLEQNLGPAGSARARLEAKLAGSCNPGRRTVHLSGDKFFSIVDNGSSVNIQHMPADPEVDPTLEYNIKIKMAKFVFLCGKIKEGPSEDKKPKVIRLEDRLHATISHCCDKTLHLGLCNGLPCFRANKHKTFRPKKKFPQGTLRYQLHKQAEATLRSGIDLRNAVRLPSNENVDDWLAVHTVDFFNRINLMYGAISDVCTEKSCPTMSGGSKYEYLWQDGVVYKKPTRLPAPDYVRNLMEWIERRINNEEVFPTSMAVPFPKDFKQVCKKILTRLFRVFVHIYIHHFDRLVELGAEPHANTLYKHFYFFVTEHSMVSPKELEALKEMTEKLLGESGLRRMK